MDECWSGWRILQTARKQRVTEHISIWGFEKVNIVLQTAVCRVWLFQSVLQVLQLTLETTLHLKDNGHTQKQQTNWFPHFAAVLAREPSTDIFIMHSCISLITSSCSGFESNRLLMTVLNEWKCYEEAQSDIPPPCFAVADSALFWLCSAGSASPRL